LRARGDEPEQIPCQEGLPLEVVVDESLVQGQGIWGIATHELQEMYTKEEVEVVCQVVKGVFV
jgi:hypothetical protein